MQWSEHFIQDFLEGYLALPDRYFWKAISAKDVEDKPDSPDDFNKLYWRLIGHQIEQYGFTFYLRAAEIIDPCISLLNHSNTISSAILSRSLLELASHFVWYSNNMNLNILRVFSQHREEMKMQLVKMDETFDKLIDTALLGSRHLGHRLPDSEPISHIIRKASKITDSGALSATYSFLCDISHPNVIGNARFWENGTGDVSKGLAIDRKAESPFAPEIMEKTVWALAWSAMVVRNGYKVIQEATQKIRETWPEDSPGLDI
jgi:hypothetical protein